jgi:CBS domain-containing protein
MLVTDILKSKPADIHQIIETATLSAAASLMAATRIGALVVEGASEQLTGLISEREITSAMARWGGKAHRHLVSEVMIRKPPLARPTDRLMDLIATMTQHRARHVPIVEDGALVGILSIGDLLKSRYNTWRNESTERNRNIRTATFEILTKLGELERALAANN